MCVENNAYLRRVKGKCVKIDTSLSPVCAPIALAVEDTTRFNATIPTWLRDAINPDCREVGIGPRKLGGDQAVVMTALLVYLELPEEDRLRLARSISARDESSVRRDFNAHWVGRAMRLINELGEGCVGTLEAAAQVVRGEGLSSNQGNAAGRPPRGGRTSKRRRPA